MIPNGIRLLIVTGATLAIVPRASLELVNVAGSPELAGVAAGLPILAPVWVHLRGRPEVPPSNRAVGISFIALSLGVSLALLGGRLIHGGELLALAPTFFALLVLSGLATARRAWPPALLLVGTCQAVLAVIATPLAPLATAWSRWAGLACAQAVGLAVGPVSGTDDRVWVSGWSGVHQVVIDASCGGATGLITALVLAIVTIEVCRPAWWRALLWVSGLLSVIMVGNALRLAYLLTVTSEDGTSALAVAHREASLLTSPVVILAAAGLGWILGLRLRPPAILGSVTGRRPRRWPEMLAAGLLILAGALVNLASPSQSGISSGFVADRQAPPPSPARWMSVKPISIPVPPGWQTWHHADWPWAAALFSAQATWQRHVVATPQEDLLWVDCLAVPDPALLALHTVDGCFHWHQNDILSHEIIALNRSLAGEHWIITDSAHHQWSVWAWSQPIGDAAGSWLRLVVHQRLDAPDARITDGETLVHHLISESPGPPPTEALVPAAAATLRQTNE